MTAMEVELMDIKARLARLEATVTRLAGQPAPSLRITPRRKRPVMSSAVEEPLTDEEVIALLKADGLITDPAPMVREAAAEWEALSPDARPLVSVPAMYDGEHIALLGAPPSREPYRVLVTFVEPVSDVGAPRLDLARFWASFGAWRDDRPTGEILADIHDARRSRPEPPAL